MSLSNKLPLLPKKILKQLQWACLSVLISLICIPNSSNAYAMATLQKIGFDNQLTDTKIHWQYLGKGYHRAYNPIYRRLMTKDTLSPFDKGGINGYIFAKNNPIKNYDPSGHIAKPLRTFIDITVWITATILAAGLLAYAGYKISSGLIYLGYSLNNPANLSIVGLIASPIIAGFAVQKLDGWLSGNDSKKSTAKKSNAVSWPASFQRHAILPLLPPSHAAPFDSLVYPPSDF